MLSPRYFPPELRLEKEARSIIKRGDEVHVISLGRIDEKEEDEYNGIKIHRLKMDFSSINRILYAPVPFNPFWRKKWIKKIEDVVNKYNIDILQPHDIPLAPFVFPISQKRNIPVIIDMHENIPAAMREWAKTDKIKKRIYYKIFNNPSYYKKLEFSTSKKADYILAVIEEQKERLVKSGIDKEKVYVIKNTEEIKQFLNIEIDEDIIKRYKNYFSIVYIGGFGHHRGLDIAVKAMSRVKNVIPNAKLVLIGGKTLSEEEDKLKNICKEMELENNVEFINWVNFQKVPSYIKSSNLCLVPHRKSEHTDTTIPHKLFQYMIFAKPVIVSDSKPLKRIVEELDCGLVFKNESVEELSSHIINLYKDPKKALKRGNNGKRGILDKYNWENDSNILCELYDKINK